MQAAFDTWKEYLGIVFSMTKFGLISFVFVLDKKLCKKQKWCVVLLLQRSFSWTFREKQRKDFAATSNWK